MSTDWARYISETRILELPAEHPWEAAQGRVHIVRWKTAAGANSKVHIAEQLRLSIEQRQTGMERPWRTLCGRWPTKPPIQLTSIARPMLGAGAREDSPMDCCQVCCEQLAERERNAWDSKLRAALYQQWGPPAHIPISGLTIWSSISSS